MPISKASSNAVAPGAKGDLVVGTTTNDSGILGVGSNGETLVADSSTSTGLRWQQPKTQNAVYNSGMDIWQRGTSFTGLAGSDYTADRWVAWATTGGQSNYVNRQAIGNLSVTPNQAVRYSLRFGRTASTTNTGARFLFQTLETADSVRFTGKTITFSFYARRGANYSGENNVLKYYVWQGTGTDQIYYSFTGLSDVIPATNVTLTTSWQRFQGTATVATNSTEIAFGFGFSPLGTAGADDWFEITGVQLEEGSVATPYSRQSGNIAGEFLAAQRYYEKSNPGGEPGLIWSGNVTSGSTYYYGVNFKVQKRVAPTITLSTNTSGNFGTITTSAIGEYSFRAQGTANATVSGSYIALDTWNASAEL